MAGKILNSTIVKWLYLLIINIIVVIILQSSIHKVLFEIDTNTCTMTYMMPSYHMVPTSNHSSRYHLYLYREVSSKSTSPSSTTTTTKPSFSHIPFYPLNYNKPLKGIPVLFIPGNSGSHKQIRSVGSKAFTAIHKSMFGGVENPNASSRDRQKPKREYANELDIFTVDFEEELSALGGELMYKETTYVNQCIKLILELYNQQTNYQGIKPTSVILIGHSMGGLVARMSVLMPNHIYGSVTTIITLNSSHRNAPIYSHTSTSHFYHHLNRHWSQAIQPSHFEYDDNGEPTNLPSIFDNICVISIAGGHRDTLIRSETTSLEGIVHPSRSLSVLTTSIPHVLLETDHQSILWCNEIVVALAETLLLLGHPTTKQNTYKVEERLNIFKEGFKDYAPNALGYTQYDQSDLQDYNKYLSTMKEYLRNGTMSSLIDVIKTIPFEKNTTMALLHKPSLTYRKKEGLRITSSSSPESSFYIHYKVSDMISVLDSQEIGFYLTTSLPSNDFSVILYYDKNMEESQDISYKSFYYPPLPPLTKSPIASPTSQLILKKNDLENVYSILITFSQQSRKQRFVAITQFKTNLDTNIFVSPIGLFEDRRYILPAGHPMIINFTLPFFYNKAPLKVYLRQIDNYEDNDTTTTSDSVDQQQILGKEHQIILPSTYQHIPRTMEEGKFIVNSSITRIRFHQSSVPSMVKMIEPLSSKKSIDHVISEQTASVAFGSKELLSKRNVNLDSNSLERVNELLEQTSPKEENDPISTTTTNDEHQQQQQQQQQSLSKQQQQQQQRFRYERKMIDHPHLLMTLDPFSSFEVTMIQDVFAGIGQLILTHASSVYPTTYALFLWLFAAQLNSWRKKDEIPNLLVTLRDEVILLSPFFIVLPILLCMIFDVFGYSELSHIDWRFIFPDPFIDQFMVELLPPLWSIPLFFISSTFFLTLLILVINVLFSIGSMINQCLPSSMTSSRFHISNYQLSFSKWIIVGGLVIVLLHSALGLVFFLLFLLISHGATNGNNTNTNGLSSPLLGLGATSLLKKKPSGKSPHSLLGRDLGNYQQSIFLMYLLTGVIIAPNLIVWIKHLTFEWVVFDSYELFVLVAITHICLSISDLNLNNLFILRAILIGTSALVCIYCTLLLYRVLDFTIILSIVFIVCHIWSLKEKNN